MSSPKLNSLLTGAFVAIIIAMGLIAIGGSAMAQDGLRLWKPYNLDSMGGGRRINDGVYGSISGVYWSISTPTNGYIGATTKNGKDDTRWVYSGNGFNKVFEQTNSIKIKMMDDDMSLGTRFEVGNRRGHHGWLVTGYGLPGQTHRMSVNNATMAIRDNGNLTLQPFAINHYPSAGGWDGGVELGGYLYVWDRGHNSMYDPTAPANSLHYPFADWQLVDGPGLGSSTVSGVGYLWGVFTHAYQIDGGDDGEGGRTWWASVLAPVPIVFANVDISVSTTHLSTEAMYTYRAHPFTWGSMELLAGGRYWEFDDKFSFFGSGPAGSNGSVIGNNVNYPGGGTGDDGDGDGARLTSYGPLSILSDMTIRARGINRVFGPQVGMKVSRSNARWTFGAEGRAMAGINAQTVTTKGRIASNYGIDGYYSERVGPSGHDADAYVSRWMPIGLQYSNQNFGHKKTQVYFSPVVEMRLCTDWQWTDAVSLFGALDGMWADNIARGVRITDYVVRSDGTIFGIRGNDRNTSVAVYGVEAGVKVRR